MLLRALPELAAKMPERAFGKEVQASAPHSFNPFHGSAVIHKAQNLYLAQVAGRRGPGADFGAGIPFSRGDAGRCYLYPVHLQLFQQQAGNGQFLVRIERDAGGLFPVAQGGVHHFHHRAFFS